MAQARPTLPSVAIWAQGTFELGKPLQLLYTCFFEVPPTALMALEGHALRHVATICGCLRENHVMTPLNVVVVAPRTWC